MYLELFSWKMNKILYIPSVTTIPSKHPLKGEARAFFKQNCLPEHFVKKNAKTKVINSCLNPVWNEEMVFSIKEPVGIIKFEVFDRDRFKSDDKMGHAFLDLQPLAAATKLRRALKLTTGETKLRKVAPSADNCLLSDSFVTYADGEIVLDSRLRLRDVESGELFVTVKWTEADAK
ncbi:unnamed protein product [Alopecurus aequalis]